MAAVGLRKDSSTTFLILVAAAVGRRSIVRRLFPAALAVRSAGNAAYDFLRDRPSGGGRPSTLPATRPGGAAAALAISRAAGDRVDPAMAISGPVDLATGVASGGDGNRPGRPGEGGGGEQLAADPGDLVMAIDPADPAMAIGPATGMDRPGQGGGGEQAAWRSPGRPGDRPDWANRPNNRPDRNPNWNQWQDWRHNQWTNVNNNWNNNWNNYDRYFNDDWWNHHPYWRFNDNFNYWGWATWPAVTSWFPWGWSQPVYYNYGSNVYYQDDMVYYGNTPVATAADYAYQAERSPRAFPRRRRRPTRGCRWACSR